MVPKWSQDDQPIDPKTSKFKPQMSPKGAKMEPEWSQEGVSKAKKSKKNANASKKRDGFHSPAPLEPKKSPTWLQLRPQNAAKIAKKSMQKCIIF